MRGYTLLTREEQYQIYALKKGDNIQAEIAEIIGRDPGRSAGSFAGIGVLRATVTGRTTIWR